ncbi:hypothetical protein [Streptomyces gelaticus]|nr:hypothetical protein [Streptomyces gelaticus]
MELGSWSGRRIDGTAAVQDNRGVQHPDQMREALLQGRAADT